MKKIKSFISLLILISIVFTLTPAYAVNFSDTVDNDIMLISNLGIMQGYDDGTFAPDSTITRAEFAEVIANLFIKGESAEEEWNNSFWKDMDETLKVIPEEDYRTESIFSDVEKTHWAYNSIQTVYSLGLMNGVSEKEFAPELSITIEQIYKVIVTMLGYDVSAIMKGGYPKGYRTVANELKLSAGIETNVTSDAKRSDVAKILENAFDVEVLQLVTLGEKKEYKTFDNETFLTKILGIDTVTARLNDNGWTDLGGDTNVSYDNIVVGNTMIRLTEDTEYIRDYLGRTVEIYFKHKEDENCNYALYAVPSSKDVVTTFEASQFVDLTDTQILYNENDKVKSINVSKTASFVLNGSVVKNYDKSNFEKLNKAIIKIVKPQNSTVADCIIVDSYSSFIVDVVDTISKKIYSTSTLVNDDRCIDLENENKRIVVYNEKGEIKDFSIIKKGDCLSVSDSDNLTKVYVEGNKISGATISESREENGTVYASIKGKEYIVSEDYIELKGKSDIKVGKVYTVYIDRFNEIVNLVSDTISGIKAGYYIDMKSSGVFEENYDMKVFTEDGVMQVYSVADKVILKDTLGIESTYRNIGEVFSVMQGHKGLFRYKLNQNKEIDYIELPGVQAESDNEENRLLRIRFSYKSDYDPTQPFSAYYKSYNLEGKALLDNATTKLFVHPPEADKTNDELYRLDSVANIFINDERKSVLAYTISGDSAKADYIVCESSVKSSITPSDKNFYIVKSIVKGLDLSGEPANVVKVYAKNSTVETVYYCDDSVINDVRDIWKRKTDPEHGNKKYKIETGDIIRIRNNADGTIAQIELIFDENEVNPISGGFGTLAGSYGYYDSQKGYVNSMPYVQDIANYNEPDDYNNIKDSLSGSFDSNPMSWSSYELRNFVGYPVYADSASLKVTTKDLTVEDKFTIEDSSLYDNYIVEDYKPTASMVMYVIEGDELYPLKITGDEIKSYKTTGKDCDRIFMSTRAGTTYAIIPIRGYTVR